MKIGIYCGSFDPVHKGHLKIVKEILRKKLVDQIWIIITGDYKYKQNLTSIEDRIEMWKYFENEKIIIDTRYNSINKTYALFEQITKENPVDQFYFILGADNLIRLNEWIKYEQLLKYPFIIIKRKDIKEKEISDVMQSMKKTDYDILDIDVIDISSTEIRSHIDCWEYLKGKLDSRVYRYILKNGLYR